jgi:hypothetical protein
MACLWGGGFGLIALAAGSGQKTEARLRERDTIFERAESETDVLKITTISRIITDFLKVPGIPAESAGTGTFSAHSAVANIRIIEQRYRFMARAGGSEEFSLLLDCFVMKPSRSFASDNNAVVHPRCWRRCGEPTRGIAWGMGTIRTRKSAVGKFREQFGEDVAVFFVFNGTAANVLSLQALTRPYHAVLCPGVVSYLYVDECGAPEKLTGMQTGAFARAGLGKLTVEAVAHAYHGIGDQHHVQPRVISITQSTEMGSVYRPAEIEAAGAVCA